MNRLAVIPICLTVVATTATGCFTSHTTRCPSLWPRGAEVARREAQVYDPYPDEKWGPQVGFRPLQFTQQRSVPQQAKDRFFSSFLKTRYGSPAAPAPAPQLQPQMPPQMQQFSPQLPPQFPQQPVPGAVLSGPAVTVAPASAAPLPGPSVPTAYAPAMYVPGGSASGYYPGLIR